MNLRRKLLLCGALLVAILLWLMSSTAVAGNSARIRVASKPFTESFILSEMVAQLIEATGEAGVDLSDGHIAPSSVGHPRVGQTFPG